jgi:hypothetical protein
MNTMNSNFKPIRICMAAVLALVMCLFTVSTVLADPTVEDPGTTGEDLPIVDETFMDDPHGAYINLVAEVPEGFRGSVSVMLRNEETGEMYTITVFRVTSYSSDSELLPYGKYSVERAFTSENSLAYEAFVDEDSIDLTSNYTLHAKVVHNEAGQAYIDGNSDVDKRSSDNTAGTDTSTGALEPDDSTGTDQTPAPDKDSKADQQQNTPADEQPESKGSVVAYVLKVILGTAVFVTIVFGTVYIVRKKQGL